MAKKTFENFKEEVENLLMERHGIGTGDCTDDEQLQVEFKTGSTAEEFVEFIAEKHDLDRIDQPPFV